MSRSLKKGPYINVSLEKKILAMNESGKKNVVKTSLPDYGKRARNEADLTGACKHDGRTDRVSRELYHQ